MNVTAAMFLSQVFILFESIPLAERRGGDIEMKMGNGEWSKDI